MSELPEELHSVAEKIKKLLQLADKNPSAAEAASAAAKAQELMEQYNLDAATIERASGKTGEREKSMVGGGMYQYQRELWEAVAQLNFCMYFTRRKKVWVRANYAPWRFHHQLIGRTVNVAACKHQALYLETAIERLLVERLGDDNTQRFSRWAVSFREGAVDDVVTRLTARRSEKLAAERRTRSAAATGDASSATALTLSVYVDQETDANIDFLYGEGTAAAWAANRRERARQAEEEDRRQAEWAAANPEKAARAAEKERERERRAAWRPGPRERDKDWGAFRSGQEAGAGVSLDEQVGAGAAGARRLR